MPSIKVKKGGIYTDPVGIFAKKAGVYSAVQGVFAKSAGAYGSVFSGSFQINSASFDWTATSRRVAINVLGNSHAEGAWASTDSSLWRSAGCFGQTCAELQAKYGDGGEGWIGLNRGTRAGTWTQLTDFSPFGQAWYSSDAAATYTMTVASADNLDLFYARGGSYGPFSVSVDGGEPITVTPTGSADSSTQRVNIPLGAVGPHTVVAKPITGNFYYVGVAAYKGSVGFVLNNIGRSGSVIADNVNQIATKLAVLQYLSGLLTIVDYVSNDFGSQTAVATYRTRWDTLLAKLRTYGEVLSWIPPDTGRVRAIPLTEYEEAARAAANAAGASWLDFHRLNGAYAANTAFMYDDTHWNLAGHTRAKTQGFIPLLARLGA